MLNSKACQRSVPAGPPWGSARELSLSPPTWGGGPPPHFWLRGGWRHHASFSGYGRYYCGVAATWNGWFLTIWVSASTPFIHTGGPRRGRSFRRRLRQWCRWHGTWNVEMTSYVYIVPSEYVTARLHRHWGRHRLCPVDLATVIHQVPDS